MVCENCHKNEATATVTKYINGELSISHLCVECAAKLGLGLGELPTLNNMLSGLFSDFTPTSRQVTRCPLCGASYDDFARSGKAGCANCYDTFYQQLLPSLQRIHGKTRHTGKLPCSAGIKARIASQLEELKRELSESVTKQEFEQAAILRDKINELEKEAGDNGRQE